MPTANDLEGVHWRTAIKTVQGCNDLDELAGMHEAEQRPKVLEAIEGQMNELRGDE